MWLRIENLSLKYENKEVFRNYNLEVTKKNLLIYGSNGSGKSSMLNTIYRYVPYTGSIYLLMEEIKKYNLKEVTSNISYIKQFPELFEDFSLKINLKLLNVNVKLFEKYVNLFKVNINMKDLIKNMSGGEKQIVNLCIGFTKRSQVLLMDEPLNDLSAVNQRILLKILEHDKRYKIIVLHQKINLKGQIIRLNSIGELEYHE